MAKLTGTGNGLNIEIDTDICFFWAEWADRNILRTEGFYGNLRQLSEDFRDTVGIGAAADFLIEHNIPRDHPLWYLGEHCKWQQFANNYRKDA